MIRCRYSFSAAACRTAGFLTMFAAMASPVVVDAANAAPMTPAFSIENLKHDTQILSSDEFEGRGPLSAGEDKSVAYITAAMKKAGLQAGVHGSYLQPVPLLKTETLKSPAPRFQVAGESGSLDFAYGQDVTLNTRRGVTEIDLRKSEVVF